MVYHALKVTPTAFFLKNEPCHFALLDNGFDSIFPGSFRVGEEAIELKDRTSCLLFPDSELNGHLEQLLGAVEIPQMLAECFATGAYEGRCGFLNYLQIETALRSVGIQRKCELLVGGMPLSIDTFQAACASYFDEKEAIYEQLDDLIGTNPRIRKEKFQSLILAAVRRLDNAFAFSGEGAERAGFFQMNKDDVLKAASINLAHSDFDCTTMLEKRVVEKLVSVPWPSLKDFERAVQSAVFPAWKKKLKGQKKFTANAIFQRLTRTAASDERARILGRLAFGGEERKEALRASMIFLSSLR